MDTSIMKIKMAANFLIYCFAVLVSSSVACSSQSDSKYSIAKYREVVGLPFDALPVHHRRNMNVVTVADHEPETYKEVLKYHVDKNIFFYINKNSENKLVSAEFFSQMFRTKKGTKISDSLCNVVEKYPEATLSSRFDQSGFYIYMTLRNEQLNLKFDPVGVNDDVITKYLRGTKPTKEETCKAELMSMELFSIKI